MDNYNYTTRTNYFRVTDEAKYQDLFAHLSSGDSIHDFSKQRDGVMYHAFGSYDSITYADEEGNKDFDEMLHRIQEVLPDDEAFVYLESGYDKLRSVNGCAIVVTSKEIVCNDILNWVVSKTKELLGNNFETQLYY